MSEARKRGAFAGDARAATLSSAAKVAWWGTAGILARRLTRRRSVPPRIQPSADPPPAGFVRRAWIDAFQKEARDIAEGLYPARRDSALRPVEAVRRTADFLTDAFEVHERRRRGGAVEVADIASPAYPAYYRQNFHFQTGGWFTDESAQRYEDQVEALFSGAAGPMRRRALALLARAWRGCDQRGCRVLDVACGTGAFLGDLAAAFPRARLVGLDLSPAYLKRARGAAPEATLVQANAERLPFATASFDAVTAVYLFHELPASVRKSVAAEIGRVLKPGGHFALADSIQPTDEPRLARLIEAFPAYFHEPYYPGYARTDLRALFAEAGLTLIGEDRAFMTKALLFEKR